MTLNTVDPLGFGSFRTSEPNFDPSIGFAFADCRAADDRGGAGRSGAEIIE